MATKYRKWGTGQGRTQGSALLALEFHSMYWVSLLVFSTNYTWLKNF